MVAVVAAGAVAVAAGAAVADEVEPERRYLLIDALVAMIELWQFVMYSVHRLVCKRWSTLARQVDI